MEKINTDYQWWILKIWAKLFNMRKLSSLFKKTRRVSAQTSVTLIIYELQVAD